ncbi:hypothetical protein CYL31_12135 [Marinomonas sp. A3A]|jgi:hypothetical protein|uniref:hypothetical protein n=1 Tax=Marinomonas TaxID=28253 RepID=UPI001BB35090|nr:MULTISPECIES: hypothetical protein [Marinomonas]QUX92112.1 hypothetical protein CYL31_12135 [Marinomonas sp. A3A]
MEIIDSTASIIMKSGVKEGLITYCRYGLPHLVCLPIHRPNDPLLSPSLAYLKVGGGYFADQFFSSLHPRLNQTNIISKLYFYVTFSSVSISDLTLDTLIEELACFVASGKLLVIPLYDQ